MAVLAFVALFVLLALGALFLAFGGASKKPKGHAKPESRSSRRGAIALFLASIVVLGVGVPAFVLASEDGRDSVPEAGVAKLDDKQKLGRELFGQRCRNCHTLKAANATAKIGPSLDTPRNEALILNAIEEGRAGGNGNMAAQIFEGEEAQAVAEFVALASGGKLASPGEEQQQTSEDEAAEE